MLLSAVTAACLAAPEHARRFQMELAIVAGDARASRAQETPAHHKRGLAARIESALGSLRLLARLYLAERGESAPDLLPRIDALKEEFRSDAAAFEQGINALAERFPLDITGLRASDAGLEQRAAGKRLYQELCIACHQHPDLSRDTPARNLFKQASTLSETEFAARMLGGVRGTGAIGLKNPLSDSEIAGLTAYLKQLPPSEP